MAFLLVHEEHTEQVPQLNVSIDARIRPIRLMMKPLFPLVLFEAFLALTERTRPTIPATTPSKAVKRQVTGKPILAAKRAFLPTFADQMKYTIRLITVKAKEAMPQIRPGVSLTGPPASGACAY